jgi:hypothetical protein
VYANLWLLNYLRALPRAGATRFSLQRDAVVST